MVLKEIINNTFDFSEFCKKIGNTAITNNSTLKTNSYIKHDSRKWKDIFYYIENSTEEVDNMLKRNKLNINSEDIKKYFINLPKEQTEDLQYEFNELALKANYQMIVINYILDVLKIDDKVLIINN